MWAAPSIAIIKPFVFEKIPTAQDMVKKPK